MSEYAVYKYSDFLPTQDNPLPYNRIMEYLVTGPFVMETDGSFEYEHFYARDKILREDYLLPAGGEKNINPSLGDRIANNYIGKQYLYWKKGHFKFNALRFDGDNESADPAIFATEQRNAVYYATFRIVCEKDEKAVIAYRTSGSALFVNGELVDFKPYGQVKGLWTDGYQALIKLHKGSNLIMFKIRPGYIADNIEISMENCTVFPVIASAGGLNISLPHETAIYFGTQKMPRRVFPFFIAAKNNGNGKICFDDEEHIIDSLSNDKVKTIHPSVYFENPESKTIKISVSCNNETDETEITLPYRAYEGFVGQEIAFSDFHFDTTYHQEQRTYALGAMHITKSMLDYLDKNPEFKLTLSEIDYLHPYYSIYPHHRKLLRDGFKDGRIEADCLYNQPNDLTSSGEALVRNLCYGQIYHRDVLGRITTVYCPGDVFGHFSQLSQFSKKGQCKMIRWAKTMLGLDLLNSHMSPDGTTLINDRSFGRMDAMRMGMSVSDPCGGVCPAMEYMPRNDDTQWHKKTLTNMHFGSLSERAEIILNDVVKNKQLGKSTLQQSARDITRHHSGVMLTRTDFKQANRRCENLLSTAEKLSTAAFLLGAEYPDFQLDKAWRQLLCAQHHDSITGTNNEISFVDLMIQFRECAEIANKLIKQSTDYIVSKIGNTSEYGIVVINPAACKQKSLVSFDLPSGFNSKGAIAKDKYGVEYPVMIKDGKGYFVPAVKSCVGYSLFTLSQCDKICEELIDEGSVIENSIFRLTVDKNKGGGIVSLIDKRNGRELIDSRDKNPANMINILHEIHDRMETQHEIYTTGESLISSNLTAELKRKFSPIGQRITATVKMGTIARVITEITLLNDSETIDFRTIVEDYNSTDHLFSVTFPMNIKGGAVVYDDRFAPHISTRSKNYMSFGTHQYASFTGCSILPSNRWFGIGPSVTVKTGNSSSFNIGMTAIIRSDELRNIADKLLTALCKKAIPVTCYSDEEKHGGTIIPDFNEDVYETDTQFCISSLEHPNTYAEKLIRTLNDEQLAELNTAVNTKGVVTAYFTDSDNIWNKKIDVMLIIACDDTTLDDYVSGICSSLSTSHVLDFTSCIKPFNCNQSDDFGAVILNSGNISCSVEGESTLNLMLFHTASFYGNAGKVTGGDELVPEKKTHAFTYRLYPHNGSYREGKVYDKAAAFDEPLTAVVIGENKSGSLADEMSLLSVDGSFVITAVKPGGYPLAKMCLGDLNPETRCIVIRGYECDGIDGQTKIRTAFPWKNAYSTDLLEENKNLISDNNSNGNTLTYSINSHSIETLVFSPKANTASNNVYGKPTELNKTVFVRSWEHDMGSMPMGFLRKTAVLDRKIVKLSDTAFTVNLNLVNNCPNEEAEFNIKIECSDGISASCESVNEALTPVSEKVIPIDVKLDTPATKGLVTIYYTADGINFTDVCEFGYFNPEVSLIVDGDKAICRVTNPYSCPLNASLTLASPFELWGNVATNGINLGNTSPFAYDVELSAGESKEFIFNIDLPSEGFFKSFWLACKLACNGRVHYAFDEVHGPRHNYWAHEFYGELEKDGMSIKKLMELAN